MSSHMRHPRHSPKILGYVLEGTTLCAACAGTDEDALYQYEATGIVVASCSTPCRCTCDQCGEYLWGEIGRSLP